VKALTTQQMIRFLPPEPEQLAFAVAKYARVLDSNVTEAWLNYMVKEGAAECYTVCFNDVPIYLLWFRVEIGRKLFAEAAVSLTNQNDVLCLHDVLRELAKQRNCDTIEFRTRRPGLVAQFLDRGATVHSVVVTMKA
jgi:hypothetical protein